MIIGLTGKNASGKGNLANYLQQKGFCYYSLSDVLRDIMKLRKIVITRQNLINFANNLRKKYGPSILSDILIKKIDKNNNYVIDSIRNPEEIKALRKYGSFVLFNVVASSKIRFERIRKRNRPGDPKTYQEFIRLEKQELQSSDEHNQQLLECSKLAEYVIKNNGSLEEFHNKIDIILKKLLMNNKRPTWDKYFIDIAKVIATRSNCMKRKVAAIVVKDKRIISTGYNGTPRGTKNCNEGGCPRCNNLSSSGKNLEECFCSHGEENAIVQAAYHGISLKGSTLYTTHSPCLLCSKMIINSGIKEIVFNADYPMNQNALKLLKQTRIKLRKVKE